MQLFLNENTESDRKAWAWTPRNEARVADIHFVLDELKEWWPVTARQVYYRLISHSFDKRDHWLWKGNRVDIYRGIIRTLKWMRIDKRISWDTITDEHRILTGKLGFENPDEFIKQEVYHFLRGYDRCMAQKQDRYIELWIEKAALLHILQPIADEFCRRVVVCKGYGSITFQTQFYERATRALGYDQKPTVLYFGDWDPSGVNMIHAAMQTLSDELGLWGVEYYRRGINPEHFEFTPADPIAIKASDTRAKRFVRQHGATAYELDALHPKKLQQIARQSIEHFTDMDAYENNKNQEMYDREDILALKHEVYQYVYEQAETLGLM